ncbi:MAG TPA: glutamate 5-kinase [Croceibacterium sp.]|nr:glutamate 5-kinase [Croceibacterium sp.]
MSIAKLPDLADPTLVRRLVIKVGSALLVDQQREVRRDWLGELAGEIAEAVKRGQHVVVVSSGAIALGAGKLGFEKGGRARLSDAQAAAAVGQIALAGLWAEALGRHGLIAAQLLLTVEDLDDRRRYLNAAATLGRLLKAGAVPVVNENDSVATHEIRFGDNDRLAARVGQAASADAVLLLSDVDGLFDRDPSAGASASLQPLIHGVTDEVRAMASAGSASGMGSGGMVSKLQAAEIAERAGIALAIVNGRETRPVAHAIEGGVGTLFLPRRRDVGRKAWLGGRMRLMGALTVDNGCVAALKNGGSLLATGITAVDGNFERGDPVAVHDRVGRPVAQGLAEYGADEIARLKGRKSDEHEAILGYSPRSAVIHRDQLVIL